MNRIDFGDGKCTVTEAASWLQVSRETIYNWVSKGELRYIHFNGVRTKFFLATDLDYIRHNRVVAAGRELQRMQDIPSLA